MVAGYINWPQMSCVVAKYGRVAVCALSNPTRKEREEVFDLLWIESSYHGMKINFETLADGDVRYWAVAR